MVATVRVAFAVVIAMLLAVLPAEASSFTLGDAADYAVLYEGTGSHNFQVSNSTINGNIGIGGTGDVQFSSGTINGQLDFSPAQTCTPNCSQDSNAGTGPTSVSYSDADVTAAIASINALSSSFSGGTDIALSGNQTIDASNGTLEGTSRVFDVTSYSEGDGDVVTIDGDAAGDTVVFDFAFSSNVTLGGDVTLTGGLLTTSNVQVSWSPNNKVGSTVTVGASYPFQSIVGLLPSATVTLSSTTTMIIVR